MSKSTLLSTLKAYSIPIILFSLSLYCQLIIIPRSFPTSHYDGNLNILLFMYSYVCVYYFCNEFVVINFYCYFHSAWDQDA